MQFLDTLAHWLGWLDIVAALILLIGAGLPARVGRAPRGMVRCLFYGVGLVLCRHDLQPLLSKKLQGIGYRFVTWRHWHLGVALPGKVKRMPGDSWACGG